MTVNRALSVGFAALAAASVLACNEVKSPLPPIGQTPEVVALQVKAPPETTDIAPTIRVTVNSAPSMDMLLDTGSAGMRVFSNALSSGSYIDTGLPISQEFGTSGSNARIYYGDLATAQGVSVAGIEIPKAVYFQVVKEVCYGSATGPPGQTPPPSARCVSAKDQFGQEPKRVGGSGIFGVRPLSIGGGNGIFSLMSELPGFLASGFIISLHGSTPTMTIGITQSDTTGFETYPVQVGQEPDEAPYWIDTEFPWCYAIQRQRTEFRGCAGPVLTDTGGQSAHLYFEGTPPSTFPSATSEPIGPGWTFVGTLGTKTFGHTAPALRWTLTSGTCPAYNDPTVWFGAGASPPPGTTSNNGVNLYLMNDVLYDLKGGRFGVRPVKNEAPSFCQDDSKGRATSTS